MGFGVHSKGEKHESQEYLGIIIESRNDFNELTLRFEGASIAMPDKHFDLPDEFVQAAKSGDYKIGITVKVAQTRLEVTLRAGRQPRKFVQSLELSSTRRKMMLSLPWAVLSRDGRHGITIYPDVIREKVDLSVPAPPGRYRFAGEKELYGLYRAAFRLGDSSPKSLLVLKQRMVSAVDKGERAQAAAMELYEKYAKRVASDIAAVTPRRQAELALGDMLGLSLSLDLNRESPCAHPAVVAYVRCNTCGSSEAAVRLTAPVTGAPQRVSLAPRGKAARASLKIGSRPEPYGPFLIKADAVVRWQGLTARAEAHACGNPTIPVWWVAAPFDNRGNTRADAFPLVKQIDVTGTVRGKGGGEIHWRKVERQADSAVDSEVVPDFMQIYGELKDVSAYAVTFFDVPTGRDAVLRIGSDDGVVVWLNGEPVHENLVARGYDSGQDQAPIHLKAGRNTLLVETTQSWGGWKMGAHILDINGIPFDDLKFVK
jgi:hypothetical protein